MKSENKVRSSNLELLRIVSMILIVLHHYAYNNFTFTSDITLNKLIIQILLIGGKIGVNCFILITGYFMINSKFKIKKLLKILLQVLTYSITFLIFAIIFSMQLDIKMIVKSLLPIIYSQYWFITVYVIIYVFSNYINDFINVLNEKRLIKLILLLILMQVIIPTFTITDFEFSNVIWFMTLYIIGAYIRKFPNKWIDNIKINKIITVLSIMIVAFSIIVLNILAQKIQAISQFTTYFTSMNSIFIVMASVSLFLVFRNMKIKNSNFINNIATTMFGVYLIHTNIFMREFIWIDIFKVNTYLNANTFALILNIILSVTAVFIVCIVIDLIRQKLIEPLEIKVVQLLYKKFLPIIKRNTFINKCVNYINN